MALHENIVAGFIINEETGEVSQKPLPEVHDGDDFLGCVFPQFSLTEIFKGVKNLSFKDCNLANVVLDRTWDVDDDCLIAEIGYNIEEFIPPTEGLNNV